MLNPVTKKQKIKKVKFGELEDLVMECIWELLSRNGHEYVDVKSVIQLLSEKRSDKQYVYTTIHTTCLRLCKKKRLEKVQIKNKYFYKTSETKELALKNDLMQIFKKYFDGDISDAKTAINNILDTEMA